jgi:hypothetical protein
MQAFAAQDFARIDPYHINNLQAHSLQYFARSWQKNFRYGYHLRAAQQIPRAARNDNEA